MSCRIEIPEAIPLSPHVKSCNVCQLKVCTLSREYHFEETPSSRFGLVETFLGSIPSGLEDYRNQPRLDGEAQIITYDGDYMVQY